MMDYHFVDRNTGVRTAIAELPTAFILECLAGGVLITDDGGQDLTDEDVMERLRIELVARSLPL